MKMKNLLAFGLLVGFTALSTRSFAEERLFLDVITNAACLNCSHAIIAQQANYGSITHVFDGIVNKYSEDHRYLLAGKAQQLFIEQAPGGSGITHADLLKRIANKRLSPKRYRLSRVTGYENSAGGVKNSIERAPCEWCLFGICRGEVRIDDAYPTGNTSAGWGAYADRFTNVVRRVLLDHRKDVFWPNKTCNPAVASATYPYEKDCNWLEFPIDEKFADWDFAGYRLYCVDSTRKQKGEDITFGLGQFEVYVDYEDYSSNASDYEIRANGATGVTGFSPALGSSPEPGTVCSAPATYVDADGQTWFLNGWTRQTRLLGWRDTDRGFTSTYTIPERDGFLHRLVWNYEKRSPRKATRLFTTDKKALLGLSASVSTEGDFNYNMQHLFDGVFVNYPAANARALGYIYKGCSATVKFSGTELANHRLVPIGYRVIETDYENNQLSTPGRSPTAWNLYGIRSNGQMVLIASETGRQSIAPYVDDKAKPMLPNDNTGVVYPLTTDESNCREGFVGFKFQPLSSIWHELDPEGTKYKYIDFSLNEVEIFVETNALSEVTVASDIVAEGFSPAVGSVVTESATLTAPAAIEKGGMRYVCAGYRLYTLGNGVWTLSEQGEATSFAYAATDQKVSRLVWQWRLEDDVESASLWRHVKETPGAAVAVTQGGVHFGTYPAYRAFDGDCDADSTNRWLSNLYCGNVALTVNVTGLESERLVPKSYTLQRSQTDFITDARRAPSAWVLYGIPAGCETLTNRWVELDRRSDVYWSDNTWQNKETNPLRAITRSYPITAKADEVSVGFAAYRFVPLRTFLYDLGQGCDKTIDETGDINFGLAELVLDVLPCGKEAIVISSTVEGDSTGFQPFVGSAFRTSFTGVRTCTAPATLEANGTLYASAGYAIETLDETTGEWTEETTGEGTAVNLSWATDGVVRRLLWKWTVSGVRVNADPENGTELTSYSSGEAGTYRPLGESVSVTANGNATSPTSTFLCWTGDVEGIADVSNATLTVTTDRARRLVPKFRRNWLATWNESLKTIFVTDGNWKFSAWATDGTDYHLSTYYAGSGDLDFDGEVSSAGGPRKIVSLSGDFTHVPITSFRAPETLQQIRARGFYECFSLTNLVFDSPVLTNIWSRTFARSKGLRRITFGPRTRSDLTLTDLPFLCEYPNQHPDEIVFQCAALPDAQLLQFLGVEQISLVERSLVFRVDRDLPGWRGGAVKRAPTALEKLCTPENDRKNFRGVFTGMWGTSEKSAKIIYIDRGPTGLTILVK